MSDIAVVVLDWFSDDCEAFWVYTRIMQRIRANFEKSQKAIKACGFETYQILLRAGFHFICYS